MRPTVNRISPPGQEGTTPASNLKFVCRFDVMRVGGGAEYHHWNGSAFGMSSKPSQEIESRGAWHFDIRDDQAWRRIMLTILIRRLPLQVSNGVFAISANMNRCDASLPKGTS